MGIEYKQSKNEFISDRVLKDCGWGTKIGIHELKEKNEKQSNYIYGSRNMKSNFNTIYDQLKI